MSDEDSDTSGMTDEQLRLYQVIMDALPDGTPDELRRIISRALSGNLKRYHVGALEPGPAREA